MLAKLHSNIFLQKKFFTKPYRVQMLLLFIFIVKGFFYSTPMEIVGGVIEILTTPDVLVTDNIAVGGLGTSFVVVGLTGLTTIGAFKLAKHTPNGLTLGTLGLTMGLAFFGKNPLNIIPIFLGGYLYARFTKKPYGECCLPPILAACLAPSVTQLIFSPVLPLWLGFSSGLFIGLAIGFFINPLAAAVRHTHGGYNLYNVGFAAGIFGIVIFALFVHFGLGHETANIWSSGYDRELMLFLAITSIYFITCGVLCNTTNRSAQLAPGIKGLIFWPFTSEEEGNDYFKKYAEKSYINMGILGLGLMLFMFLADGNYSGPVIGAILSVVGFGAYGKALHSATPVVFGAIFAAFISMVVTGKPFNSSDFLVAIIFSTCLSPLSKRFGIAWGFTAGFLHLTLAANITVFHGGLNLYNNGFAGGLAAMFLLPIIKFFDDNMKLNLATKNIKAYDKKANNYDDTLDGKFTEKFKIFLTANMAVNKNDSVLDVGCGNGTLLAKINDTKKINGFGADISPQMIANASARNPNFTFAVAGCGKIPFDTHSMDAVTVCAAYHHFPDTDAFAAEAKRLLKPGGSIYIAEICLPIIIRHIANIFLPFSKDGDVKFYSSAEITATFANAGFGAIDMYKKGHIQVIRFLSPPVQSE